MTDAPQSAKDPRDGEPYYIDSECPDCGKEIVLYDSLTDEQLRENEAFANPEHRPGGEKVVWYDEWVCPECLNGVHMDWPDEHKAEVFGHVSKAVEEIENGETASVEDLERALNLDE